MGKGMEVPLPPFAATGRRREHVTRITTGSLAKLSEIAAKPFATFSISEKWCFPLLKQFQFKFPLAQNSY